MTIEQFLFARIAEARLTLIDPSDPREMMLKAYLDWAEKIIDWHKDWPVLLQEPIQYTSDLVASDRDQMAMTITQRMAWITQEEYVKRFGVEPPTAPLLMRLASKYADHPDFKEEWLP